ncbi:hypothetical protein [Clostridium beijerinckii]|uniref:hypothetical protein n=1 Tax=Clostridium beijerinckii TaxID=1520 RepID=UPI001F2B7470|nr:hypothetical protein [Clostridium beijerinckii]
MIEFLSNFLCQLGNRQDLTGIDHNHLANSIDTIIVKRLTQTNTVQDGRDSHQTHIAITGDSMSTFDTSEISSNVVDLSNNGRFRKNFVVRNEILLLENNINLLSGIPFTGYSNVINTYTHAAETMRQSGDVQVEISYLTLDGQDFINFRSLLRSNDYLIFLRKRDTFEFLCLAIRNVNLGESTVIRL